MRHRKKGTILDRKKGPREMLLRNLTASVLMYEKVTTTEAKAKAVRPLVEKMITFAKKGDLSARRELIKFLPQELAVKKAMDVLGERYKDREGGYTRLVKLGNRPGDGAKKVQIQLV
ncbi:50S ribosomal protein L17 [bacterium]|nr:50S ribosomal protein L17 [bacterium]